ncbi:hypothetical protein VNO80_08097 [Phaseolus coccineus]|uniref:Uncharacterized protein n=1 Tax=Phaseolus coccineus TaxID=3886 RepID=A0AAN9RFX5_PHACN
MGIDCDEFATVKKRGEWTEGRERRRTVAGDRKLIDGKACYIATTSYVVRVVSGEEEHGVMGFCVGCSQCLGVDNG